MLNGMKKKLTWAQLLESGKRKGNLPFWEGKNGSAHACTDYRLPISVHTMKRKSTYKVEITTDRNGMEQIRLFSLINSFTWTDQRTERKISFWGVQFIRHWQLLENIILTSQETSKPGEKRKHDDIEDKKEEKKKPEEPVDNIRCVIKDLKKINGKHDQFLSTWRVLDHLQRRI